MEKRRFTSITTQFEILTERLLSFVYEIDIAPLAALEADMQPPDFRACIRMGYLQPGEITHPACCPVAESKDGSATPISRLLDQ